MHAEAVLLVDDGEREIAERDVLLEQRVGADQQIDVAEREPFEQFVALAAALAAGEDRDRDAGRGGERRDGVEMLARQDFGRRHQRGLAAAFDHGRGGEQRHHGLARADVALQQAQHALGLGEIGDDVGDRARLRGRERVGQRLDQLLAQVPGRRASTRPGRPPQMGAHQRERELAGEQFVIGEPRPGRASGRHVGRLGRPMHGAQRLARTAGTARARPSSGPAIPADQAGGSSAASAARRSWLRLSPSVSG